MNLDLFEIHWLIYTRCRELALQWSVDRGADRVLKLSQRWNPTPRTSDEEKEREEEA